MAGRSTRSLDLTLSAPIKARLGDVDPAERPCTQCGHPWTDHLMCAESRPPTRGWIECPVESCKCHSTWSMSEEDTAAMHAPYEGDPKGEV